MFDELVGQALRLLYNLRQIAITMKHDERKCKIAPAI